MSRTLSNLPQVHIVHKWWSRDLSLHLCNFKSSDLSTLPHLERFCSQNIVSLDVNHFGDSEVCLVAWLKKQIVCWAFFLLLLLPGQTLALSSQKDCHGEYPDINFEMHVSRVPNESKWWTKLWFKVLTLIWYLHGCVCNNERRKPSWWLGRWFPWVLLKQNKSPISRVLLTSVG